MVFQQYALFPHLSVAENVAFGLEARGVEKTERLKRAHAALEAVGLGAKSRRPVQALSGGEQQRVALARATVIEPQVLLLDEPLSNLDPTLREAMRDDLRAALRRSGATTMFVTHDQEDAFAVADRVALLSHGRLLQLGTPEDLYHRPASRDVAEFIGRATLVPAEIDGSSALLTVGDIPVRVAIAATTGGSHAIAGAARPDGSRDALAVLRPEGLALCAPDSANAWNGEVVSVRFAGSSVAYRVRLAGDVICEVASSVAKAVDGERVGVRIASEPVTLVPA